MARRIENCFIACVFAAIWFSGQTSAYDCGADEYEFQYTQCDENGNRWRVSVPKSDSCTPTSANYHLPIKGTNCKMECEAGEFLNMNSQQCESCQAGTYSSGNSARYDDWEDLHPGFSTSSEPFKNFGTTEKSFNCSKYEWKPQGSYLAVLPGECAANLIYSVTLVKAGTLNFEYQLPSDATIFHVTVQNDQCRASTDKDSSKWPQSTSEGEWKSMTLTLKSGFNVITWRVIGISAGQSKSPVLLRKVYITGVAFSSDCNKCPAGTYSGMHSALCTPCPENTYSGNGAMQCTSCDTQTEYSVVGSTNCTKRPACTEADYYQLLKPCNQGKTGTIYEWIKPTICNVDLPESAKLPESTDSMECRPCNPGMQLVNNTCQYCPPGHQSDGTKCNKCPAIMAPDYGYVFQNWNYLPDDIKTTCVSFVEENCNNQTKWLPFGDHLGSHFARGEGAYLVLQIEVAGFRTQEKAGEGGTSTVGQLSIVFETKCDDYCQFVLLSDETGKQDLVNSWDKTVAKTKYTYDIKRNGSVMFTLAFQNSAWLGDTARVTGAEAKIYSIEITNTLGGGARTCRKCPKGANEDGCVPCPDGAYIDPVTTTCVNCPPGTIVSARNAYGASSCKPCGHGLKVYKGRACVSNGQFTDDTGRLFDLRNLSNSFQFVKGSLLFTSSGTQYYHGFNISLFGDPEKSNVICENNVTRSDSALHEPDQILAKVCRTTLVPATDDSSAVMTTQSTSLGDLLVEIVRNHSTLTMINGSASLKGLYTASGFDIAEMENDIQVHFSAETPTRACPMGRHSLVSLRCDEDQKGQGEITLPPKCADGTCDGCTFHFLWSTKLACPVCQKEDFSRVVGECVQGSQTIHYFPPSHCIVPASLMNIEETQKCTVKLASLPLMMQIAIPLIVGLALIFFVMVCFFWRKNKKLEYRYMKLVENAGGADGELPGVDSCALEEGEDEQGDAVQIRSSKGARFFKKLTNKIKKDDAFESAVLNERMPLT